MSRGRLSIAVLVLVSAQLVGGCELLVVDDIAKTGEGGRSDASDGGRSDASSPSCEFDDEVMCEDRCVNLLTHLENCGECGNVCDIRCVGGVCDDEAQLPCEEEFLVRCDGECVSRFNSDHCGASEASCGEVCHSLDTCTGSCEMSEDWRIYPDPLVGGSITDRDRFVCPESLTEAVASVICRQLGFAFRDIVRGFVDPERLTIGAPVNVTCLGDEAGLESCAIEPADGCSIAGEVELVRCVQ